MTKANSKNNTKSKSQVQKQSMSQPDTPTEVPDVLVEDDTPTEGTEVGPEVTEQVTSVDVINDMIERIEQLKKNTVDEYKSMVSDLRSMKKTVAKLEKKKKKRKPADPNKPRTPSGITRPVPITDELTTFLGLESGTLIRRTDVTKLICQYIKDNNLQSDADGRQIDLTKEGGAKLRTLLSFPEDQGLTYFNLQTYLKDHFIKNVPVPAATPVAPVTEKVPESSTAKPEVKKEKVKTRTARRVRKTRSELEGKA
jgi:chromatin remodeling complex protein RSC6